MFEFLPLLTSIPQISVFTSKNKLNLKNYGWLNMHFFCNTLPNSNYGIVYNI